MSSQLVAAIPRSPWSSSVASTIRRRVCATAEALPVMSYLRGDIFVTNILRIIIVADVVLPTSPSPAPQGGTDGTQIAPQSPTARGRQYWFFGMLSEVKASAADTGGMYTLLEITAPPGLQ